MACCKVYSSHLRVVKTLQFLQCDGQKGVHDLAVECITSSAMQLEVMSVSTSTAGYADSITSALRPVLLCETQGFTCRAVVEGANTSRLPMSLYMQRTQAEAFQNYTGQSVLCEPLAKTVSLFLPFMTNDKSRCSVSHVNVEVSLVI